MDYNHAYNMPLDANEGGKYSVQLSECCEHRVMLQTLYIWSDIGCPRLVQMIRININHSPFKFGEHIREEAKLYDCQVIDEETAPIL